MFDTMVNYLIITFIAGYVITLIFRLVFAYLNKRQSNEFLAEMEEKMKALNIEAKKRSGDFQESMDMIAKDHADMMKHLSDSEGAASNKDSNKVDEKDDDKKTGDA